MGVITTEQIKELRDKTGVSVMQCKKALEETNGNMDEALMVLRKVSGEMASKKADRTANEGSISISINGDKAVMVILHSETDFVAQNADFLKVAQDIADMALAEGKEQATAKASSLVEPLVLKIGENIQLGEILDIQGGVLGGYTHHNRKAGAIVSLSGGTEALAKDIAMHIAAMNPQYVKADEIPAEAVEKSTQFFMKEVEETAGDKPEEMKKKILDGKVQNYLKEQTLNEQPFFKNPDMTVGQYAAKEGASVVSFIRYKIIAQHASFTSHPYNFVPYHPNIFGIQG